MKSDSAIFSFIENFPTSASLKTADTGKYIANNIHNSIQFGIKNPKDLEGLTIQDVKFNQKRLGDSICAIDPGPGSLGTRE